eukprot:gene4575-5177_t
MSDVATLLATTMEGKLRTREILHSLDRVNEDTVAIRKVQGNTQSQNTTDYPNIAGRGRRGNLLQSKSASVVLVTTSMTDTDSCGDCDSEVGYESDDKNSEKAKKRKSKQRSKLERERKLATRKYYEQNRSKIYRNDSDTTVESYDALRIRRKRRPTNRELKMTDRNIDYDKHKKIILPSQNAKKRSKSKSKWTDSGISMSKTDSQPSTLGEQKTLPKHNSSTRLDIEEGLEKDGALKQSKCNKYPGQQFCTEDNYHGRTRVEKHFSSKEEQYDNRRKPRSKSIPLFNEREAKVDPYEAECRREKRSYSVRCKTDNIRHPEIIRKTDIEKDYRDKERSPEKEVVAQTRSASPLCNDSNDNVSSYTEKECEILQQLMRNAKVQRKESADYDDVSQQTTVALDDKKSNETKMQKLKRIFRIKRNASMTAISRFGSARESTPFPADSRDSLDSSSKDQFCFRDMDGDVIASDDHLANLGRPVGGKGISLFKRLFRNRKSKMNSDHDHELTPQRRQSLSDLKMQRKRAGSTRSLPEAFRDLWLRSRAYSMDESNAHNSQQIINNNPKVSFQRSVSNYSLHNHLLRSSGNAEIRSPLSPVHRSKSLRSLNIGGNFDIATHVLQSSEDNERNNVNNNLFCHEYFGGKTTSQAEHVEQDTTQQHHVQCYCGCAIEPNHGIATSLSNEKSPLKALAIYGQDDLNRDAYVGTDNHYYDYYYDRQDDLRDARPRESRGSLQANDNEVIAPLSVTKTQKKRAEKIRLK